ncbi:hypothetical protein B0I37DRAFT_407452 [Chaetomium sp. MPI-CAGE-AT-0009]|nr:hypothetical protein B0I37DRAFT_407452 [Chaetomium sp. MPI-CAGE-AT-0009]
MYPVTLPPVSELNMGNDYAPFVVNLFESAATAQEFFDNYVDTKSPIRNLEGLVDFNNHHPEKCLPKDAPDQSWLVKAVGEKPSPEKYREAFGHMLRVGRDGLARTFHDNELDLVILPMDSPACSMSTASNSIFVEPWGLPGQAQIVIKESHPTDFQPLTDYPIANVPLGRYPLKGELSRPFGLAVFARPEQEGIIFRFMSAYEASFPPRAIPERFVAKTGVANFSCRVFNPSRRKPRLEYAPIFPSRNTQARVPSGSALQLVGRTTVWSRTSRQRSGIGTALGLGDAARGGTASTRARLVKQKRRADCAAISGVSRKGGVDGLADGLASIKKTAFKVVVAVFFTLATLSVFVRAGARVHTRRNLTLDDYLLVTAAIILSGGTGLLYSICDNLYLSSAIQLEPSITLRLDSQRVAYLSDAVREYRSFLAITWTAIFLVKLSFLAFFRWRIGKASGIQRYYWVVVALTAISWVLSIAEPFILCPNSGARSSCFGDSSTSLRATLAGLTTGLDLLTIILIPTIPIITRTVQRRTTPLEPESTHPLPKSRPALATAALLALAATTTAIFSAVRASRAAAADLPQTAFWLALQACTAVLAGSATMSRSLGDSSGGEDKVQPIKEKAEKAREEVRQVTSSPVPRSPPIAYHYPMWGPQSTQGQFVTEEEIRAGQDLIWLNPSLQASQTSFGGTTLHERRGSDRRGSERRGSERRGSEPVNQIVQVAATNSKIVAQVLL